MKALLYVLFLSVITSSAMAIEEPEFTLLQQSGDFELRAYAPMIVAETFIDGAMDRASNQGFRRIAAYIFGKNTLPSGTSEKIAMTTPVSMQPAGEKIAMTTPVSSARVDGRWRVQFVMPAKYTLDTLPRPEDSDVKLREVPETHYAVLRFSGLVNEKKRLAKTGELLTWISEQGLEVISEPSLARYNPPWTLPFLRRNEIMVQYEPPPSP